MTGSDPFDELFIGSSPELLAVLRATRMAAATDVAILVQGESGTGKELLAQAIHRSSRRAAKPLVTINCAALPAELAESEMFGHRKGAFTGAVGDTIGHVRAANGGTLFLDEVGELPLAVQAKLLRFLDSGEVQAVGESTRRRVDVRIIAATNRDLKQMADEGRFRLDLFYRLNVVPMALPPLKDRISDLPLLLEGFTRGFARAHDCRPPKWSREAMDALMRHSWPGNVRELRNLCERMVVLYAGSEIRAADLPLEYRAESRDAAGPIGISIPEDGLDLVSLEQTVIRLALEKTRGNRSRAARLLGLTRDTLLYRIKKHAIEA